MSSIVRPLTEGARISTGKRVHTLERRDKGWHVRFEDETSVGPFQAVAVAAPAAEARLLLGRIDDLVAPLSRVRMVPCWALMVRIEEKILPDQDVYSDMSEVIRWIARNNTKPGRNPAGENLVIHASPTWSREAEDADPEDVAEELWSEVSHVLDLPPVRPSRMTAHLWRQGLVDQPLGETHLYSAEHKAGIAGDWCLGRLRRTCIRKRRSARARHHQFAELKSRRFSFSDVAFGELPRSPPRRYILRLTTYRRTSDGSHIRPERAARTAALAAPSNLFAFDQHGDVDRASHHRCGVYFGSLLLAWWLIAAATGPDYYNYVAELVRYLARQDHSSRLHLGSDASHDGRVSASDLGHRPRL